MAHIMKTNSEQGYRPNDYYEDSGNVIEVTEPATDEAKQWNGWGTALKPSHEPICVARKPLEGTIAQNVLEHGTGALNIDASRVGEGGKKWVTPRGGIWATDSEAKAELVDNPLGRWPANFIHDGSEEVVELFPTAKSGSGNGNAKNGVSGDITPLRRGTLIPRHDSGSAARFFYCAKASKADRNAGLDKNTHPTVKPTDLMRYLVKMVTPPGGTTLDPFMGSGSTGRGALLEGFNFIGIEMTDEYIPIATARIEHAKQEYEKKNNTIYNNLFEEEE
jgi:site-specific DNA-methyltransferase (adenine-specific)